MAERKLCFDLVRDPVSNTTQAVPLSLGYAFKVSSPNFSLKWAGVSRVRDRESSL